MSVRVLTKMEGQLCVCVMWLLQDCAQPTDASQMKWIDSHRLWKVLVYLCGHSG